MARSHDRPQDRSQDQQNGQPAAHPPPRPKTSIIAYVTRFGVALSALCIAIAISFILNKTAPKVEQSNAAEQARELSVFTGFQANINRQWSGYGLAESLDSADVPARLTATATAVPEDVLPGTLVTPETVLAQLDAEDFEQQVETLRQVIENLKHQIELIDTEELNLIEALSIADDSVAISENDLKRVEGLAERRSANQKDLDNSRRDLLSARQQRLDIKKQLDSIPIQRLSIQAQIREQSANLKLAELSRGRVTIKSPIEGVLLNVDIEQGENVQAGTRVARVVNLNRIEIPIHLPASARASVKVGDEVLLSPSNGSGTQTKAKIQRIAPGDSADSRTVTVYAVLEQPNANARYAAGDTTGLIVPGQFLSATVVEEQQVCSFVVPRRSMQGGRVMVVRNGQLDSLKVATDFTYRGKLEQTGLPDDEWAVLETQASDETTGLASELKVGDYVVLNAATTATVGELINPNIIARPPSETSNTTNTTTPTTSTNHETSRQTEGGQS